LSSITETPNELTLDIDVASPVGIVRLLRAADSQICNGYRGYPGLCDDEIVACQLQSVQWAAPLMGKSDCAIVIAGAGTSGRLAMVAARTFNQFLVSHRKSPNFHYLIAGGNLALIKAQEGAEDDPHQAWTDLLPIISGKKQVLYIGVTCGLSAPYVAGQLHQLSRRPNAQSILMGFNPEQGARDVEVENWDRTFADVVRSIRRKANCLLLNPVVGPEPITGSTRMKSGSATKLMLEVIFSLAARQAGLCRGGRKPVTLDDVRDCVLAYEQARLTAYKQTTDIGRLVELGGKSLRAGGHIYYVGSGPVGILGIVDASECPPTFGADFDDIRGYIAGGWNTLLGPGHDMSHHGGWYQIALENFEKDKLRSLSRKDLVVALATGKPDPRVCNLLRRSRKAGATTAMVQMGKTALPKLHLDVCIQVERASADILPGASLLEEYSAKHVLNALTTGAHILCGKVYRNRMVDLRISNNKLYFRTLGIIQSIMGVTPEIAKQCLLRSIYETDRPAKAMLDAKPSQHVEAAKDVGKVVPKALIMAGSKATHRKALEMIRREPIVRTAVERLHAAKHAAK